MMPGKKQLCGLALLAISAVGAGFGDTMPTPQADIKGLTEIVTRFEAVGCQIVDASFDKGRWQLEGYRNDLSFELAVDRETGLLKSMRQDLVNPPPPPGAKPLSQILTAVQKAGWTRIASVELDHGQWDVAAYHNLARRELHLDAISGAIVAARTD